MCKCALQTCLKTNMDPENHCFAEECNLPGGPLSGSMSVFLRIDIRCMLRCYTYSLRTLDVREVHGALLGLNSKGCPHLHIGRQCCPR